jgi:hypothetical protein
MRSYNCPNNQSPLEHLLSYFPLPCLVSCILRLVYRVACPHTSSEFFAFSVLMLLVSCSNKESFHSIVEYKGKIRVNVKVSVSRIGISGLQVMSGS